MGCGFDWNMAAAIKKAAGQASKEISRVPSNLENLPKNIERAGKDLTDLDWYNKVANVGAAALTDPGAWITALPSMGTSFLVSGKKAWKSMSQAERDEARSKFEGELAARKERSAKAEQEKMVSDRAKAAADQAKERAARLGQGRRGLLYQGTGEQGVTQKSSVLGG